MSVACQFPEPRELDAHKLLPEDVQDLGRLVYVLQTLAVRLPRPYNDALASMSHVVMSWLANCESETLFTGDPVPREALPPAA